MRFGYDRPAMLYRRVNGAPNTEEAMASIVFAILLVIAIFWSGWAGHRFWIGPSIKRHCIPRAWMALCIDPTRTGGPLVVGV